MFIKRPCFNSEVRSFFVRADSRSRLQKVSFFMRGHCPSKYLSAQAFFKFFVKEVFMNIKLRLLLTGGLMMFLTGLVIFWMSYFATKRALEELTG
jgi:hypothetical protein